MKNQRKIYKPPPPKQSKKWVPQQSDDVKQERVKKLISSNSEKEEIDIDTYHKQYGMTMPHLSAQSSEGYLAENDSPQKAMRINHEGRVECKSCG